MRTPSPTRTLFLAALTATLALSIRSTPSRADDNTETYGPYTAPPVAAAPLLTAAQIDQLTAPIALYPDPLLAQLLPAATYPVQIVEASRWLQANPTPTEDAINQQPWESPIKALVHYPTVLQMMNDQLDWTQALGNAFINQQSDLMSSIQRLRAQAQAAGTLQSNQQQTVELDDSAIQITPADPNLVYIPQYNPQVVYVQQPAVVINPITWTPGFHAGLWLNNGIDWDTNFVAVGIGWNNGWHPINHHPVDNRPPDRHIDVHYGQRPPAYTPPKPWTRNNAIPRPIPAPAHRPIPEQRGWPTTPAPTHPAPPPNAFNNYEPREDAQRAADRARQDQAQAHSHAPALIVAPHPPVASPPPHAPPPPIPPTPPPHPIAPAPISPPRPTPPAPHVEAPPPHAAPPTAPVVHSSPPPAAHPSPSPPVFQVPAAQPPSAGSASNRGHESMHH